MIHDSCGGKLKVIESIHSAKEDGLMIYRIRECTKCGETFYSHEFIAGAKSQKNYKHSSVHIK